MAESEACPHCGQPMAADRSALINAMGAPTHKGPRNIYRTTVGKWMLTYWDKSEPRYWPPSLVASLVADGTFVSEYASCPDEVYRLARPHHPG